MDTAAALPFLHRCTHGNLSGRIRRQELSLPCLLACSDAGPYLPEQRPWWIWLHCWGLLFLPSKACYWKFLSLQRVPQTHNHLARPHHPGSGEPTSPGRAAPQYIRCRPSAVPRGPHPGKGDSHLAPSPHFLFRGGWSKGAAPESSAVLWGMRS